MKPRHLFCIAAGACDTTTGLLLLLAPLAALRLMRIPAAPLEPVFVRFIGAFVFGVGFSYLRPFFDRDPARREARLAAMLDVTAFVRTAVGTFVAAAIVARALHPAWASVAATDLVLAAAQFTMLRRGVFHT